MKALLSSPHGIGHAVLSLGLVLLLASSFSKGVDSTEADAPAPLTKVPFRDAATSKDLGNAFLQVRQNDPASKFEPTTGDDPSITGAPKDIVKESDILCYNGVATLLPKGSIIHIPEILQSRIGWKEDAKLVTWSQFFESNRGWITTMEIDFEQAKGVAPVGEEKANWLGTSSKLVIATFKKGPITMLPFKGPETEGGGESTGPATRVNGTKPTRFNFKR